MAFKKMTAQRLFNAYTITRPSLTTCRICSSTMTKSIAASNPDKIAPDPGEGGSFRRSLHRISVFQSLATSPELRSLPIGQKLLEKLRGMDIARDRIRLDGLIPPPQQQQVPEVNSDAEEKFTVADARKVLRLAQLEVVKSRLRQMEKDCISYPEFIQICNGACSNAEQALEFAKMLDQSGIVIVLGNVVFLKPDKVVKAMEGLIMPMPLAQPNDPQMMKELQQMEEKKSAIDKKAESLARRELLCGLGFFVIQTAAFMRLTFWELSWDVMEPICFYVTSFYCIGAYVFFLRTSKEPTFEGIFHSRFSAKQKKLMKLHNFDIQRYNELRKVCDPHSSMPAGNTLTSHSLPVMSAA